jgi:hypothetical protein
VRNIHGARLSPAEVRFQQAGGAQKNIDELPVVDPEDPTKLIGMLRRKEAIAAYHDQLVSLRKER